MEIDGFTLATDRLACGFPRLADGVFAAIPAGAEEMAQQGHPIATSADFVIGSVSVLVIDTIRNQRLNAQLMDLIKAETDLPLRYAVNTSFHGGHSYGNQYLPEETRIIQHKTASGYIAEHLEADKAFMIQNFGTGRGIEEMVATPALPWLLDGHLIETRRTLETVLRDFDQDTRIVPDHGPVTDIATIQWNVDYLGTVETAVKAAIADGLTLDQTVERVKLPEFQGYALFG